VSLLLASAAAVAVSACAAAPRQRPVMMGPASGTLQQVRQQFQGTWDLVSFEAVGDDGRLAPVQATGTLTYDEFGNMAISGRILDAGASVAAMRLNIQGRTVIDTQNQRVWVTPQGDTRDTEVIPEGAAFDRFRYYEFSGNQVTLTVKDASGAVTARTVWKRQG
jgi:hypothetical protein